LKATQVSDHIWSLKTWIFIPIHVWVVVEEDGVTLVDAGLPMMSKGILGFINKLQAGPLQRIVLTHGHPDHVGAITSLLKAHPVPVHAHRLEIPYLEGDMPYKAGKKVTQSMQKGGSQALRENEHGVIQPVGSLTPYHTPGHSPGHVVYYHQEDRVMLAGDLFSSRNGKLRKPLFTPNMSETVLSSSIVGKLRPARLEVCHGYSVFNPAEQLETYVANESKHFSQTVR
jgi:glyoxylase-like metal-dependent hydrolase (beta-lactamase superfamily II)